MQDERRRFQRMKLAKPILGDIEGQSALILDVGIGGAFVEHYGIAKPGDRFTLTFRWKGDEISFECVVKRTSTVRRGSADGQSTVSHSGVEFVEDGGASATRLQDMMATFVGKMLAAHKANAMADVSDGGAILYQLGQARRSRTRGFLTYTWNGEVWTCTPSTYAGQPKNGFTVGAYEDEEELETLCRAYEAADDEGRNLIRLVAELSASKK
jgi:PilZ domain-containing protein